MHIEIKDNAGRKKNKAFAYRIYLHFTQQCMVKVEIPLKPPILFLFDPELCKTVYRAAGAQPIRPGVDA